MAVVVVFAGLPMILLSIYRTNHTIQTQLAVLTDANKQLRKQKKKSDDILYLVTSWRYLRLSE